MELTTAERITLLELLPAQGSYADLKIVNDLRMALSFSEEEVERLQFQNGNQTIQWKPEADLPKAVDVGKRASEIIKEALTLLDSDSKLNAQHLPLYERFCMNGKKK